MRTVGWNSDIARHSAEGASHSRRRILLISSHSLSWLYTSLEFHKRMEYHRPNQPLRKGKLYELLHL